MRKIGNIITFAAILTAALLCVTQPGTAARRQISHTFAVENGNFVYDGKPIVIRAGEMHYARIPAPYWRHRMKMLKAMGMNALSTYVFWNCHEPSPGVWDWESGNRNLREYIKTAQEEGLMVILRPGPYVCAEWDFGGYPWWLQTIPKMKIRSCSGPFLDACRSYIDNLAAQVRDLQITKGGPIIMVQAENEYGWFVEQNGNIPEEESRKYLAAIHGMLVDAGFDVPFYTADNINVIRHGAIEGTLPCANGRVNTEKLKETIDKHHGGMGPYMVAECYPGWFDHWNEPFTRRSVEEVTGQLRQFLDDGLSFNFFMAHGGTSFGFFSGSNYSNDRNIQPDITSFDYDAPINEPGWDTPKYHAIRDMIQGWLKEKLPPIPERIPTMAVPNIKLERNENLFGMLDDFRCVESDTPMTFEELSQGYGYVLYRRKFVKPHRGVLEAEGVSDYALVYVNGELKGCLNRLVCRSQIDVDIPAGGTLDILVEAFGRINFGARIPESLKGLTGAVSINGTPIRGSWQMYCIPMDRMPSLDNSGENRSEVGKPAIFEGTFSLEKTGDTFIDMRGWGKGIVFVNGINLGRYWGIGPQQTLYLPGCWLRKGENRIVVFEQLNENPHESISTIENPILDQCVSRSL